MVFRALDPWNILYSPPLSFSLKLLKSNQTKNQKIKLSILYVTFKFFSKLKRIQNDFNSEVEHKEDFVVRLCTYNCFLSKSITRNRCKK